VDKNNFFFSENENIRIKFIGKTKKRFVTLGMQRSS
jgi:hypothetical protein